MATRRASFASALLAFVGAAFLACSSPSEPKTPRRPAHAAPPATAPELPAPPPAEPPPPASPTGNTRLRTFDDAKKLLVRLYVDHSPKRDVYCGCPFAPDPGHGLRVDLAACGYASVHDQARAARIEWEHAVPAAKFGRTFVAWREGDERCVDGHGKRFRGRNCARLASPEFARIEADLHNLFPAVGEVNGLRGDLPMGLVDPPEAGARPAKEGSKQVLRFGQCTSRVEGAFFVPRSEVHGDVARAYKYMDASYPERHILDDAHRALMDAWDVEDPPDEWERERNRRIAVLQGNANPFIR